MFFSLLLTNPITLSTVCLCIWPGCSASGNREINQQDPESSRIQKRHDWNQECLGKDEGFRSRSSMKAHREIEHFLVCSWIKYMTCWNWEVFHFTVNVNFSLSLLEWAKDKPWNYLAGQAQLFFCFGGEMVLVWRLLLWKFIKLPYWRRAKSVSV